MARQQQDAGHLYHEIFLRDEAGEYLDGRELSEVREAANAQRNPLAVAADPLPARTAILVGEWRVPRTIFDNTMEGAARRRCAMALRGAAAPAETAAHTAVATGVVEIPGARCPSSDVSMFKPGEQEDGSAAVSGENDAPMLTMLLDDAVRLHTLSPDDRVAFGLVSTTEADAMRAALIVQCTAARERMLLEQANAVAAARRKKYDEAERAAGRVPRAPDDDDPPKLPRLTPTEREALTYQIAEQQAATRRSYELRKTVAQFALIATPLYGVEWVKGVLAEAIALAGSTLAWDRRAQSFWNNGATGRPPALEAMDQRVVWAQGEARVVGYRLTDLARTIKIAAGDRTDAVRWALVRRAAHLLSMAIGPLFPQVDPKGRMPIPPPRPVTPRLPKLPTSSGAMQIVTFPMPDILTPFVTGKRSRAYEYGAVLKTPHRVLLDQRVFRRNLPKRTATILLDCSGSMGLRIEDVREMLRFAPYGRIACYSGSGNVGTLRIIANGGRCIPLTDDALAAVTQGYGGGNIVDIPALAWMVEEGEAPYFWISDGQVTGKGDRQPQTLVEAAAQIMTRFRVTRFADCRAAVAGWRARDWLTNSAGLPPGADGARDDDEDEEEDEE